MSTTTTVLLSIDTLALLGTIIAARRKSWTISFLCAVITVALAYTLLGATTLIVLAVAVAMLASALMWVRHAGTASTASRWGARSRRKAGMASRLDVARRGSALAHRRKATVVRPSLRELTRWERLRTPVTEFAVPLCRVGGQQVYASIEHAVIAIGAPRTGKTGWIAHLVLDSPGATLCTSTRLDLFRMTRAARERVGPVYVFNAAGLGNVDNTIHFNPLQGCEVPETAAARAEDLVAGASVGTDRGGHSGDREMWNAQARRVLTAFLHAAALGGKTMNQVFRWAAQPTESAGEVESILDEHSPMAAAFVDNLTQFGDTNKSTATSITATLALSLQWLTIPSACAAAFGGRQFDVAKLLREKGTVYLLGRKQAHSAPLMCALTGHIAREARRIAASDDPDSGRLDPPLRLVLDEAALTSPVPLDEWTADMGGAGVSIAAAFQSRAQMQHVFGEHRTTIMLANAAAVLIFGGGKSHEENAYWSDLAGERDEKVETCDASGRVQSVTQRRVPVITAARLTNLPRNRVLLIPPGMDPCIGRVQMAWRRRDVRRDLKAQRAQGAQAREGRALIREAFENPEATTVGAGVEDLAGDER